MTMRAINLVGQNFSTKRAAVVGIPYIDLLAGLYLFGANAVSSLPNLAYGASQNLTEISTPTYGTGYAEITSTKGFETGLLLDTPFTQIVVGLQSVVGSVIAMTARGSANGDNFVDMMRCSAVAPFTFDGWPDGGRRQSIDGLDASAGYRLYAQSWGGTGTRSTVYSLTGTSLLYATDSINITKTTTPTHTLKFGTGYNAGVPVFRIAFGALAASVLDAQKIYEIGIAARAILLARGITML